MLLKKFFNSDSESFSFIHTHLVFWVFIFLCPYFIHLSAYLFIHLYLFILFVIATGHICTPLWSTWRFDGFQIQIRDSDAFLLFFLSTNILNTRISKRVNCRSEVVSPQQRQEPLCVGDTVTSSVGIMNKQFQSKYPVRVCSLVFVSPWVDKGNMLWEHHARGFCFNFLHIVVTSASS